MIRPATTADIPRIAEIHTLAWQETYSNLIAPDILAGVTLESRLRTWKEWFKATVQDVQVFVGTKDVIGFVRMSPPFKGAEDLPDHGELSHLYLVPGETLHSRHRTLRHVPVDTRG